MSARVEAEARLDAWFGRRLSNPSCEADVEHERVRAAAYELGRVLVDVMPAGDLRTEALLHVRLAVFDAYRVLARRVRTGHS